jgi:putative Mg2+ transporter-C (MgtC) family protein
MPDFLSLDSREFWLRILVAILAGAVIGMERQIRGKVAGVRTSILICLGTEIFVSLGSSFAGETADPTRVLGQVVTGIGFLGAGVILARGDRILGVTTASVIWILAAIGSMIGLGYLEPALVITLVTVLVLVGVEKIDKMARDKPGRGSGRFSAAVSDTDRLGGDSEIRPHDSAGSPP